jgi:hypothetical protein
MRVLLWLVCLCFPLILSAQKQGNIWYFGDQAGLDFNTIPPAPLTNGQTYSPPPNGWNEGTSSICDSTGSLLFYSNGEKVWNREQAVMPNGNNLAGHASAAMAALILPRPGSNRLYYLFCLDALENDFQNGLSYSVIDMCLDGEKGDILESEKNILVQDQVAEKICGIRHSNGVDYWVIVHGLDNNLFYAYLLTENGLSDPVITPIGPPDPLGFGGQLVAAGSGQRIAYSIPTGTEAGKTFLLDFNTSTGNLSNSQILVSGEPVWGISFSPDESKFYCSTSNFRNLFQFDLSAGNINNIIASKTFLVENGPDNFRHHQIGPDGVIYIAIPTAPYLSAILEPNNLGLSSTFVQEAADLGGQLGSFGLPAFVAGYQYSNTVAACPITSVAGPSPKINLRMYPNPTSDYSILELDNAVPSGGIFKLYDHTGTCVRSITIGAKKQVVIEKGALPAGMYLFSIETNNGHQGIGKVIFQE